MSPLDLLINFLNNLLFFLFGPSEPTLRLLLTRLKQYEEFQSSKVLVTGDHCHSHHGVRRWAGTSSSMDSLLIAVTSLYLMKITIQVSSHGNYPAQNLANVLVQDQTRIFRKSAPSNDNSSVVTMVIPYRLGIPVNVNIVASRFRREEQPGDTSREKILQDAFRGCPRLLEGSDSSPDIPFLSLSHAVLLEVVNRPCNPDLVWRLAGRLEPGHRWSAEQRLEIEGNVRRLARSQKGLWWGKKKTTEQWKEHLRVVNSGSQNDSPSLSLLSGYPCKMYRMDSILVYIERGCSKDVFMRKVQPVCGSRSRPDSGGLWFSGGDVVSTGKNMLKCFTYRKAMCYGMA
ncbi:hypothetical protein ASPFODRAFT_698515 [Aspergillus luchuensis CBS 106.47]|uniref:Uncharacterized protein n=1 Tax=Aspergillus luchuensis (strain CBS 106.47) TaxID=1137211 RepID=A0A1M3TB76_ASPLC|nr:hypothetical protein ASPFODRAFT_698515 [Aspergillus luchuensis CBS 106.47]